MERTIGNLATEIKSHVHPYANLSQRALQRCQVNALKAMIPDLELDTDNIIPRGAKDLGDGYVLLRAWDRTACQISSNEHQALQKYLEEAHERNSMFENWVPKIL